MRIQLTLIIFTIAIFTQLKTEAQFTWGFATAAPTGTVTNLTASNITQGQNSGTTPFIAGGTPASTGYVGASGSNNGNCSAKIGAVSTATSTYMQVVLTPTANFWVNVTTIKWGNFSLSSTGPTTLSVFASNDNFATSTLIGTAVVTYSTTAWTLVNPTITPYNGLTSTPVTIRIYASGGTAGTPTAGTANWRMDDLVITSTAQSGTAGQIPKYTSPTTFANSIMTESNNNIGVGTLTPAYKLDVAGNLKTTLDANINGITVGRGANGINYNTALGFNALNLATTGQNTAVGYNALAGLTSTGNQNTAVGYQAMLDYGGIASVAIGEFAMYHWVSGNYNVALGLDALRGTGTGAGNIGIGRAALGAAVTGSTNTALGYTSLINLTSGSNNLALGSYSGTNLTTGSNNILIGQNVLASVPTVSNELNIGNWIYGSSGNIGIGAASPGNKLEITHGTSGNSGLRFTNLNASSTAATSSGKVLSVNSNGDVVLEQAPVSSQWGTSALDANTIQNLNTGGVIIGTGVVNLSTGYKLYVTDGIITEKLKIRLKASWPDYVFNSDYPLKPLNEIEQYIKQHKHLPDMQPAEQVKKEGIEVGETNALLLKKIEELTLYMINADKQIKQLQEEVKQIKRKNNRLVN